MTDRERESRGGEGAHSTTKVTGHERERAGRRETETEISSKYHMTSHSDTKQSALDFVGGGREERGGGGGGEIGGRDMGSARNQH